MVGVVGWIFWEVDIEIDLLGSVFKISICWGREGGRIE